MGALQDAEVQDLAHASSHRRLKLRWPKIMVYHKRQEARQSLKKRKTFLLCQQVSALISVQCAWTNRHCFLPCNSLCLTYRRCSLLMLTKAPKAWAGTGCPDKLAQPFPFLFQGRAVPDRNTSHSVTANDRPLMILFHEGAWLTGRANRGLPALVPSCKTLSRETLVKSHCLRSLLSCSVKNEPVN